MIQVEDSKLIKVVNRVISAARDKKLRQLLNEANTARDGKNYGRAASRYEEYLSLKPADGPIHVQAGHMHKEAKNFSGAEAHYLQARLLMPKDPDLSLQLGHFYKIVGRLHEASAAYEQAEKLVPGWADPRDELDTLLPRLRQLIVADQHASTSKGQFEPVKAEHSVSLAADTKLTAEQVMQSGLFDVKWYLRHYSDILAAGIDPLTHFTSCGIVEARAPGPGFEPRWYAEAYPEVGASGMNAFTHYVLIGKERGLQPVGPSRYARWVSKFDTLTDHDLSLIDRHIREARFPAPTVVMVVDARSAPGIAGAIRSLRRQRLAPASTLVCLASDCPPDTKQTAMAMVGSDPSFIIFGADEQVQVQKEIVNDQSVSAVGRVADGPVVLMSASVEVREHALYMLVQACTDSTRLVYSDEDRLDRRGVRDQPIFKPQASPEYLRQSDYLGDCVLLSQMPDLDRLARDLVAGRETIASAASRMFFAGPLEGIVRVPFVLFHNVAEARARCHPTEPQRLADAALPTVSVIVPTRDRVDLLSICIDSVIKRTNYPFFKLDIIVIDNGSEQWETLDYLDATSRAGKIRVIRDPSQFNYSRMNNVAARLSQSDILVLLNNDTEIQDSDWLRRMIDYVVQPGVGAVGPKLLYQDGTIQHGGVVLNIGGVAAHAHLGLDHNDPGAMGLAQVTHEVAAVSGACLAIRRSVYEEVGGLDENLPVAFNDVLLCLSCLKHGYRNLYVHDAWLRHFESKTRGTDDTPAKVEIYLREARYARKLFPDFFKDDPYYNPNLSLNLDDFYAPAFPPRCRAPWLTQARLKQPRRVLILSKSFVADNVIGVSALAHARYFKDYGDDVLIGSQDEPETIEYLGTVISVRLGGAEDAAIYAVTERVDIVIVHSWPYFSVARLLGHKPVTVLCYGDVISAGLVTREEDQRSARMDRDLSSASYDIVAATSETAALALNRPDIIVCPAGGDLLGAWTPALLPLRDRVRAARGWAAQLVVLVKTDPSLLGASFADLARLVEPLDHNRVMIGVLSDGDPAASWDGLAFLGQHLSPAVRRELYVAADALLDLTGPEAGHVEAAEASSFGLPVIRLEDEDSKYGEMQSSDGGSVEFAGRLLSLAQATPWMRRAAGPRWADFLSHLENAITVALGKNVSKAEQFPIELISDSTLIRWSGMFDEIFYRERYSDVAASGQDPFQHFIEFGDGEGRQPSELFHSEWYASKHPELKRSGVNLLAHYLRHPTGGFDPNPYFSNSAYETSRLNRDPSGAKEELLPFLHYLRIGEAQGRSPGPDFDAVFYRAAYPDIAPGENALLHFLRRGAAEGRMPVPPVSSSMDVYDAEDIARVVGCSVAEVSWPAVKQLEIRDKRTAVRFCIDLLSCSPDLRIRFPHALSDGSGSRFRDWLVMNGREELGLSESNVDHLRALFEDDFAAPLLQSYLTQDHLQSAHPFALLPIGLGGFIKWLVRDGKSMLGTSIEQIRWFAICRAENPPKELVRTYSFRPAFQSQFPDGLTIFGQDAFATWLRQVLHWDAGWVVPDTWPIPMTAAEQVRLCHATRQDWQEAHAMPFQSHDAALALLDWLGAANRVTPRAARWLAGLDAHQLASELLVKGVNMLGHFCYPSGLRTSALSLTDSYRQIGRQVICRDVWVEPREQEPRHSEYAGVEVFDTTIIHTQPEPFFNQAYRRAGLAPRRPKTYRIGYWYWELDTVPRQWEQQVSQLDEIWTATRFVGDALRGRFDLPVTEIMPGYELPSFTPLSRSHFGLPEGKFLFLFTFHMMSIMERKNPLGLIAAFRQAFGSDPSVGLVLKTSYGDKHPDLMRSIAEAAHGSNIIVIDSIYTSSEILALMQACDAYVSLHRSEGYGLTMMEAMLLAKPVIATNYSGNLDFMTPKTGLLVDYKLVELKQSYGPYEVGTRWAEPSTKHAADCMYRVFSQREWAATLGRRAQADLQQRMSFEAAGRRMAARLAEVEHLKALAGSTRATRAGVEVVGHPQPSDWPRNTTGAY